MRESIRNMIPRWRSVNAYWTAVAATRCSQGCDWSGCPKSYTLKNICDTQRNGGKFGSNESIDLLRFIHMMDRMAKASTRMQDETRKAIATAMADEPEEPLVWEESGVQL
jgi:hypothetical protein